MDNVNSHVTPESVADYLTEMNMSYGSYRSYLTLFKEEKRIKKLNVMFLNTTDALYKEPKNNVVSEVISVYPDIKFYMSTINANFFSFQRDANIFVYELCRNNDFKYKDIIFFRHEETENKKRMSSDLFNNTIYCSFKERKTCSIQGECIVIQFHTAFLLQ